VAACASLGAWSCAVGLRRISLERRAPSFALCASTRVFTRKSPTNSIEQILGTETGANRRRERPSSTSSRRRATAVATLSWWTTSPCRRSSGARSSVARSSPGGVSRRRTMGRGSLVAGAMDSMGSRADGAMGSRVAGGKDSASRGGINVRNACFRSLLRWALIGSFWETRFRCRL
jgi:hypothetical protein